MDPFSSGFVLLILAVSGGIAYGADWLGRKLGKKRLSLKFAGRSLRPKHVAALGTVLMGIGVSFLTIAFIAAVSSDAREWLREGRGLIVERDRLQKGNDELKRENAGLEGRSKRLGESNRQLEMGNRRLESDKLHMEADLGRQRDALRTIQDQRDRLVNERNRLVAERERLSTQVGRLTSGVRQLNANLQASRSELAQARVTLVALRASLNSYQKQINSSKTALKTSETSLQYSYQRQQAVMLKSLETFRQVQELEAKVTEKQNKVDELTKQQATAETSLQEAQARLATLNAQASQLNAQVSVLTEVTTSQSDFLNRSYRISRTEPLTFRRGEELARIVVPSGADVEVAGNALSRLLRSARLAATLRGAKGHRENGQTFDVADIFERQDPQKKTIVTVEELRQAVINSATGRVEDQVMIATSSLNAFVGEPVSLEIAVVPNPVVYHRNDMVAEVRLDGSQPEDRILEQFSDFVAGPLRDQASQDHMIPRAHSNAPFGDVSGADVLDLVRSIKQTGRTVKLQAVALEDIRAADPLKLEFRIR